MRTTDATGRTITLGDHVGGTTSGRYQGTISGPAIQLGKGQVKLLVTNCPYRGTARPENGDDVWISTDRLFLIHPATDRRFVGYRSPDGRTWTQATSVKGVLWEAHEEPGARYKALALRTRYGGDLQPVWAPAPASASMSDRSAALEALDLAEADGRVSATCPDPDHPTWLRAPDDTRGCPWCRVEELEQAAAWSGANRDRWADVHDLVEQAIEKGYTSIPTEELESALGPDPATEAHRAAPRTTGPRYPLTVVLPGGRVRHFARLIGDGPAVNTLCRKRGTPTGDGEGRPWCRSCSTLPNPQAQQSTT